MDLTFNSTVMFKQILEAKFAGADAEKAKYKNNMNKADAIITAAKAKANKQVQAERALTTAKIEIVTQQHQNAISKEQRDNDALRATTSVELKELIQSSIHLSRSATSKK